jgi:hypothetical protein
MNKKIILIVLLIISVLAIGCMRSSEMHCNYDGFCDDWETDDCPDCADVLGRGIPVPPVVNDLDEQS